MKSKKSLMTKMLEYDLTVRFLNAHNEKAFVSGGHKKL